MPRLSLLSLCLRLLAAAMPAGCGGGARLPATASGLAGGQQAGPVLAAPGVECAPFARALTGVALSGPADGWWRQAQGSYRRAASPAPGSLLVFRRSARLPSGHVSVVSSVLSPRTVLLTHANWLHGRVGIDQPALDVSAGNDWSLVRVWWPPGGALGTAAYPAYGFISPAHPRSRAELRRAATGLLTHP